MIVFFFCAFFYLNAIDFRHFGYTIENQRSTRPGLVRRIEIGLPYRYECARRKRDKNLKFKRFDNGKRVFSIIVNSNKIIFVKINGKKNRIPPAVC